MEEVYKTRAIENLMLWLQRFSPFDEKKCAVVYGGVGQGKTFTIQYAVKHTHYKVIEPENKEQALRYAKARSMSGKIAVWLDRPYRNGWNGKELRILVEQARNPIIIEDEDNKYYQHLLCVEVRVTPPSKAWIVKQLRKVALVKPDYRKVSDDVRQSLLLAYGSVGYEDVDWIESVVRMVKEGKVMNVDKSILPVVLDTLVDYGYGVKLAKDFLKLVSADYSGRFEILEGLKLGEPSFYFYRLIKSLKDVNNR